MSRDDLLEKEMVTPSSILVWEIPWTEEPGRPTAHGFRESRHDLATEQQLKYFIEMWQFRWVPLHDVIVVCY